MIHRSDSYHRSSDCYIRSLVRDHTCQIYYHRSIDKNTEHLQSDILLSYRYADTIQVSSQTSRNVSSYHGAASCLYNSLDKLEKEESCILSRYTNCSNMIVKFSSKTIEFCLVAVLSSSDYVLGDRAS